MRSSFPRTRRGRFNTAASIMAALVVLSSACSSAAPTASAPTAAPAAKPTTAPAAATGSSPAASPAAVASASPAVAAPSPSAAPAAAAPTGSPIKVGVMDDVTGVGAIEGALMRISTELVVQEVNSTGGINGHPLQVMYVDPKGDASQAIQLATQLAQQDNVDVLAGGIFSPECLGVQGLASRLKITYVALNGCASDQFTSKSCDKYSFRVYPAGRQLDDPVFENLVKQFGSKWGIIYPDYALGQSTLQTTEAALNKLGAQYVTKIAVPLGEANVTPYVTKIPTDGSIQGLLVSMTGSDLSRVMSVIQQFGINKKVAIYTALGKESFAGVYPEAMDGAYIRGARASDGLPGNKDDAAFAEAWRAMAHKNADITGPLGGPDKATPGNNNAYNAYISMKMLTLSMRKSGFMGKADTDKLIAAFETLDVPQGPDAPAGRVIMNKDDHQGRMTEYLLKINGQTEDVVATFPAESMPTIGDCKIAG